MIGIEGALFQVFVYGFPLSRFGLSLSQLLLQDGKGVLQFVESFVLLLAIACARCMHAFLDAVLGDEGAFKALHDVLAFLA